MEKFTLRELCGICRVTRRAVQGYEKQGLVRASGKTERGRLLYGNAACERVYQIRLLQNYGMTVKEIALFYKKDRAEQREMLTRKKDELSEKRAELDRLINELSALLEEIES